MSAPSPQKRRRGRRWAVASAVTLAVTSVPFILNQYAHADTGIPTTLVDASGGACADVPGSAGGNGLQLAQQACDGSAEQSFTLNPVSGKTDTFSLSTLTSGKCVDVSAHSTADNATIIQYTCNGRTNQQFHLVAVSSTAYNLVAVHSGKCITADSGNALVQLPCTTARAWKLPGYGAGSSPSPSGTKTTTPTAAPTTPTATPTTPTGTTSPPAVPGTPGSWTPAPVNPFNGGAGTFMWLLTDGSILSNGADLHEWAKLVPDANGDYSKGTWVGLATSPYGLGAAQDDMLPDGRFYQAGGEYVYQFPSGSSANDHNGVQVYDPVTNTWKLGQSGLYGNLQDTGTAHLKDGRIVSSDQQQAKTQIFDPKTLKWTAAGGRPGSAAEDGWIPMPDGSIISISSYGSYRYDSAAGKWYTIAQPPASYANGNVDTSTVTLLYDGRILAMGHNTSVIYTPGAKPSDPGSWAQGPAIPQGSFVDDVYAAPEGNGKVIFDSVKCSWLTNECGSASGALVNEFDPATNTISTISQPDDPSGAPVNFINLPNGQVLAAAGSRNWVYTPIGSPKSAWRPGITSVTGGGTSYQLAGTQLSGLVSESEDDFQNPANYPIVYLKDSAGHVHYARTSNFSSMITSKPGEAQTTDFALPGGLAHGNYTLYVSACGVSSAGVAFTY